MDKEMFPFYGFGNYMIRGQSGLGSKLVFIFATDKETAAQKLVEVVGSEGEVIVGSLRIAPSSTIRPDWLLAAAMESQADWSSGMVPTPQLRELLN